MLTSAIDDTYSQHVDNLESAVIDLLKCHGEFSMEPGPNLNMV